MKGRVVVLDDVFGSNGRSAAALVVDGRLEDLLVDPPPSDPAPAVGSIVGARVDRPAPKIGGAFVSLGSGLTGFLRNRQAMPGSTLTVQVSGHAEPGKAVSVTDRLLYKGRTMILTPGAPGVNVSRRIRDQDERERLSGIISGAVGTLAEAGSEWGWIARSAAEGAEAATLETEIAWLAARARSVPKEGEVVQARDAAMTALCEWTDPLPDVVVGPADAMRQLRDALIEQAFGDAALARRCEPFEDGSPFDHFGVWDAIEGLARAEVGLPSGGTLVVEATRALVAVDVNTGDRFTGAAALAANLEAARELPRQLRLRGLGGQVTVDFAPLAKKDRRRIEDALKTSFHRDPVETSLAGWTPLGHFELSRKRERRPLALPRS